MAWAKSYTLDFGATGDTVKQGVDKLEDNIDALITYLNLLKTTFVGSTAPTSPDAGQIWMDTNTTPYTQKYYNGATWVVIGVGLPSNHISGLAVSHSTDTEHDISIAAGKARDATDAVDMILASALVKRADATWAVGSTNGGMASGESLPTSGTIHLWLIKRSDTGVIDAMFNNHATTGLTPTLPTSYDYKRRIASFRTDGSANILNGVQYGTGHNRKWIHKIPILDISANNPGASAVTAALSVPVGITVNVIGTVRVKDTGSGSYPLAILSSLLIDDTAASATAAPLFQVSSSLDAAPRSSPFIIPTITGGIRYRLTASAAENTVYISTEGWEDML
jgi:hypothetical protein